MRCAKTRHRMKRPAPRAVSAAPLAPLAERARVSLSGDAMVSAMDRAATSLKPLYRSL